MIVAAGVLIVTGCGANEPPKTEPPSKPELTPRAEATNPAETATPEVRVAAASDLKFALDDVIQAYEKVHPGAKISSTYGSSGNFFAQLSNKAPFDVFLSADVDYPRKLIEAGHGIAETEFKYAVGRIVVWVKNDSPIDLEKQGIESLKAEQVTKIAIANPKFAPYGRAAEAALKSLGVYDAVEPRLVLGDNVAQTAQFVESGGADAGVISLSQALSPKLKDKGRYWMVPAETYPAIVQGGVVMSWAQDAGAAKVFCDFLQSEEGGTLLKEHGFSLPEK